MESPYPKKHAAAGSPTLLVKEILKEHAAAGIFQLHSTGVSSCTQNTISGLL